MECFLPDFDCKYQAMWQVSHVFSWIYRNTIFNSNQIHQIVDITQHSNPNTGSRSPIYKEGKHTSRDSAYMKADWVPEVST